MDQFPGLLAKDSRDFSSSSVFDDVFGGPPKFSNKPVYDDEHIFDGLPGLKNSSSVNSSKNVFSSAPNESSNFDDLLGNLGRMGSKKASGSAFDDLIPGFGENRGTSKSSVPQQSTVPSTISTSSVGENPFAFLQSASVPAYASQRLFSEPSPQAKPNQSSSIDVSSVQGKILDGLESNDSTAKLKPFPPSGGNVREKDGSHFGSSSYMMHSFAGKEPSGEPLEISDNSLQKNKPVNNIQESHQSPFDVPTSSHSHHTFTQNASHTNTRSTETNSHRAMSPQSEDSEEAADVWLTVSEITLTTLPTSAPPPSRPPPRQYQSFKEVKGSVKSKKPNNFSSFDRSGQSYWSPQTVLDASKNPYVSSVDELEAFAMGGTQSNADEHADVISNEENADNSAAAASAAAMKDAVDRAEVKFKHARQVRERENAAKVSGAQRESDEKFKKSIQEQDLREEQERLDCEREERGRDEKDGERRRIEKEREQALEIERDREKGRQAVDRVMKEVRERAAAEARQRSERVAVDKVNAGARERAERAAVQRAQAEARERAAREVRERAEKAASEAIERKNTEEKEKAAAMAKAEAEARIRADRASVNRANAEARERAAAAAAATARGKQQKDGNDLDSFFNASARPDNTSKPRASSPDSVFDAHRHNKPGPEGTQHPSAGTSSSMRKAYSGTNIVDDLDSIFGATSPPADIQENVGETDGRRKSRLERDQRTQERTERALAEKNERDRHTQWEQAEKQRMAESLDFEIKRWSAGKEGNLRALLATLHYVLWPECGWQPVSLTDLITYESVKKVYRKSTLFVHPDKVQQKGANLQQKYIAEKVFDLLKEAWNKLNSEELF